MTRAVSTALAVSLLAGLSTSAWAQSNATTTIYGEVQAASGATIVLENLATGVRRTVVPDGQGRYQATSMPPGRYQVRLMRDGKLERSLDIEARVGTGANASFDENTTLEAVTVRATTLGIDVSNTNNGVVFTEQQLRKLPVANDVASVVQLTPGVVRGNNSQYGNAPSIGGSGQSENAFYVNGFPITNILTQVGASELPFGAISNLQVLSGGYGAEFGRSTGGVINITTRSGSNEFHAGGKITWSPDTLRGAQRNTYYPNTGARPETDGKLQYWNQDNRTDSHLLGLYAGGPLIKDKLFGFVALEQTRTDSESVADSSDVGVYSPTGWRKGDGRVDRYLAKIDYNLTDDHHFEFTKLYDRSESSGRNYGFRYDTFRRDDVAANGGEKTINCCGSASAPGANISIFKYTGYLTDRLTVTALYGDSRTSHRRLPNGYDPGLAQTTSTDFSRVPGLSYPNPQTVRGNLVHPSSGDRQKGKRLDVEYTIGRHALRAGIDRMDIESTVGNVIAGGSRWSYQRATDPNRPIDGAFETPAQGGGFGPRGYYVSQNKDVLLAYPSSEQSAQYIQDRWQVTDRVLLDLGLRREQFTNYTSIGQAFIAQDNMIAPRLGVTWDYFGDGTLKLFANAGRYHLPVPSNLSSNMASALLRTSQYFTYTGVDPVTGAPTGLHAISNPYSSNNAYGITRDAREVTAIDLKPLSQDEFSFGAEKAMGSGLVVGAKFLYRRLNDTNDDSCDQRPIDAWAERNGVDASHWGGFQCAIINPGRDNALWVNFADGAGLRRVDISADEWGNPKAKRSYRSLNLFLEHPFSNGWYGKLDYTWSRLKGNMEGQTDSIGGGDVALTVSTDHKELMYNAYGYLPGDHRHVFKGYGYVQVHPEITVGGNLAVISGGPRNCIGELPTDMLFEGHYGSAYFFCGGKPSPRGSAGRMPWVVQLDANIAYQPAALKGLSLKMDVFSLLDRKTPIRYDDVREDAGAINPTYQQITARTSPRAVRLTLEYNW